MGSQEVLPCLKHLPGDSDTDVGFYAAESIELLKEGGGGSSVDEAVKMKMDTSGDGAGDAANAPNTAAILASA